MIENFIPRKSTNIAQAAYNTDTQDLTVNFLDGASYIYHGVPQATWFGFKHANSAGSYFYRQIRDLYVYEQL